METKVCKTCGRELPVSAFGKHPKTKDGLQPVCSECKSKAMKGRKLGPYKTKEAAPKEEPKTLKGLQQFEAQQLVDELRARGYQVSCTKQVTVEL